MKSLLLAVVLCLSARPAMAQSTTEQQAALRTIADVGQHVWTDRALVTDTGNIVALYIGGWGFECSSGSQGTIGVLIDGIELVTPLVYRVERLDVRVLFMTAGVCDFAHVPAYSGINVFIDVTKLAPGLHTATLKISNEAGVSTVSPKSVAFVVPAK